MAAIKLILVFVTFLSVFHYVAQADFEAQWRNRELVSSQNTLATRISVLEGESASKTEHRVGNQMSKLANQKEVFSHPEGMVAVQNLITEIVSSFKQGNMTKVHLKWDIMVKLGSLLKLRQFDLPYDQAFTSILYQIYGFGSNLDILEFISYCNPVVKRPYLADYLIYFLTLGLEEKLDKQVLLYFLDYFYQNKLDRELSEEFIPKLNLLTKELPHIEIDKLLHHTVCIRELQSQLYISGFLQLGYLNTTTIKGKTTVWRFETNNKGISYDIRNVANGSFLYITNDSKRMVTLSASQPFKWKVLIDPVTKRLSLRYGIGGVVYYTILIGDGIVQARNSYPELANFNWLVEKCHY